MREFAYIDAFAAGTWKNTTFTVEDVTRLRDANAARKDSIPLTLGHYPESGDPALGWSDKRIVVGDHLFFRVYDLTPKFIESVKSGEYKYVSIMFDLDTYRIEHLAILGATSPAVDILQPLDVSLSGAFNQRIATYISKISFSQKREFAMDEEQIRQLLGEQVAPIIARLDQIETRITDIEARVSSTPEPGATGAEAASSDAPVDVVAELSRIRSDATKTVRLSLYRNQLDAVYARCSDRLNETLRKSFDFQFEAISRIATFGADGKSRELDELVAAVETLPVINPGTSTVRSGVGATLSYDKSQIEEIKSFAKKFNERNGVRT